MRTQEALADSAADLSLARQPWWAGALVFTYFLAGLSIPNVNESRATAADNLAAIRTEDYTPGRSGLALDMAYFLASQSVPNTDVQVVSTAANDLAAIGTEGYTS